MKTERARPTLRAFSPHSTSLKHSQTQEPRRRPGNVIRSWRKQHEPDPPSFSLTSVSVTIPLTPAISGTSPCLRRSPSPTPRGSARNAQVLLELKGLPTLPAEVEAFLCRSMCFCSFLNNRGPLVSAERKRHCEPDMFRLESSQDCRHTCSRVTKGCYGADADRGSRAGSRAGSSSGTGVFSRWKCTSQTHSVCGQSLFISLALIIPNTQTLHK